jgi:hypothetical protein
LQDNGGPTFTHALLPGSPAIDAGASGLLTDQRGGIRPFDKSSVTNTIGGDGSDMGAFEVGGFSRLTDVQRIDNDVRISFTSDLGNDYSLLHCDSVVTGPWSAVVTNIPGTGAIVTVTNISTGAFSNAFFRVRSLP